MRAVFFGICIAMAMGGVWGGAAPAEERKRTMPELNKLTPEEEWVIVHKGTEPPGSGEYLHHDGEGVYLCRRCGAPLYRSGDKFESGCGWPAFDDEIPGAVKRVPDADGKRTEIVCATCGGHLGHVFAGERLTPKDVRHCVNSLSLAFKPKAMEKSGTAYFAAGCFWGVEYWFKKQPGVLSTQVGYMGGTLDNPTYQDVCFGGTGHAETLKVTFDPDVVDYETLAKLFFEIHDFTQVDRQGPDIGEQYRSEIFAVDREQAGIAGRLIRRLAEMGRVPATKVTPAGVFWPAEDYHQDYYAKTGKLPYCHARRSVF